MEYHIGKVSNGTEFENVSSGRDDIWRRYFEYFMSNPIFGGGFTVDKIFYIENGAEVANGAFSAYSYFAHNTVFQLLGSCGLLGLFAYVYHTLTTIIIYFKKPSFNRFIFAFVVFGFVAMAMLDVVFFKPYFTLIYIVVLTVCEADARRAVEKSVEKENGNV
jgi:O-antigen ligase